MLSFLGLLRSHRHTSAARLTRSQCFPSRPFRPRRVRPNLEALEDRCLLSAAINPQTPPPSTPTQLQAIEGLLFDGVGLALDTLTHQSTAGIQSNIAFDMPYAGPLGQMFLALSFNDTLNAPLGVSLILTSETLPPNWITSVDRFIAPEINAVRNFNSGIEESIGSRLPPYPNTNNQPISAPGPAFNGILPLQIQVALIDEDGDVANLTGEGTVTIVSGGLNVERFSGSIVLDQSAPLEPQGSLPGFTFDYSGSYTFEGEGTYVGGGYYSGSAFDITGGSSGDLLTLTTSGSQGSDAPWALFVGPNSVSMTSQLNVTNAGTGELFGITGYGTFVASLG